MLKIGKPSTVTFINSDISAPIKIFLGAEIYYFVNFRPLVFSVNFPRAGEYNFSNNLKIDKITDLKKISHKIKLPARERNFNSKKILINPNPVKMKSPARIFPAKGIIEISENFKKLPPCIRYFILLHEIGHFYYTTESSCDLFAMKNFLDAGYNTSQGMQALTKILNDTPENSKRVYETFKNVI